MNDLTSIDLLWVLLCTGQVLLMQAGFCLLESGMSRAKNSINVAIKNLIDICVSAIAYWVVGFGLMYGASLTGWLGSSHFLLGADVGSGLLAFFLFQVVFCGTATTIISGAVAERIRFRSYVIISVFVSAIVYPVFGHWAWGGIVAGSGSGWLASLGFIDFAGSTVVHSVGAWVSLAAVLIVGPRLGRFGTHPRAIQSSNLPMVVIGIVVLWFGWLGFNGGSGLGLTDEVPKILVNTMISAAAGGITSLAIVMFRLGRPDVAMVGNGVIAGLVAVTAGCHLLSPFTSLIVGSIAAVICLASTWMLHRLAIDDVIGAIPAHGFAGVWGTLAIALLTDPAAWGNGNDWAGQLAVQSYGCAAAFAWAFGLSFVVLYAINAVYPLRVPRRHEYIGLNIAEHQANSELQDLLTQMSRHRKGREFSHRVKIEPFTEIGQIAAAYNRVIAEVDQEFAGRREAQQQYESIFNGAVEGIYQTYPDGSFRSANPALAKLCGYESAEQLYASVRNVAAEVYADGETRDQFLREIALHDRVSDFRARLRRRDGSEIWISENARAVRDEEGSVRYFEGTVVDITQRLSSEQLRLQKEQAEAANNAKSEFLAGMSHEMRTPLNGIVSMLELMDEGELSRQQAKYLQIARRSSTTLLAIINDILDLSKIEAGRLELESVPFSLVDLVDETVEMLYHRAKSKGLHLSAHFEHGVPEILLGDPVRLQQILINLISNAIKFTLVGGVNLRVRLDRSESTPDAAASGGDQWLQIEVSDTGIGIPLERQSKIFEAFAQADASTTRRFGGSGLGLNICQQLVVAMGGRIRVHSELDVGSTFCCVIPAMEPDATIEDVPKTNILAQRSHSRIAGKSVLLIAPANGETDVIQDYLERWGANCLVASSVPSARQTLRAVHGSNDNIDLLMVETSLIGWPADETWPDGLEAIKRRVLIGESDREHPAEVLLSQPVRPSALLEAIETSLSDLPKLGQPNRNRRDAGDESIGKGRRVLVVDDNEINTTVASELLERLDFRADTVASAAAAITMAKDASYDVILMDCEMPVMDGFDATRELRRLHQAGELDLPPDRPLRIIAVTAQALAGQVERCFRAGMNAHLAKPISKTVFARTLRDVFEAEPIDNNAVLDTRSNAPVGPFSHLASEAALNWHEVVQRCGDSEATSYEVIRMFKRQLPEQFGGLSDAIGDGDLQRAGASSHRLKGVAATMSAVPIATLAGAIETAVRNGDQKDLPQTLKQLESEIERCLDWIDQKLAEVEP
ncbi:Signal transduction histidine-protein kinase BarA [Stieleria neptunia]|uniref:Sensory/regulatory protein RpfC n=1 Tax=Stieleria neptunia TaxID=2527979 RepID=A0A518HVP7_9BACT|nr:ammonium transporter [Stieleria neptunia]QDV44887.1 Signal transduction histidine-protein kinase BarA [Stieleria neptunia]